MKAGRFIFPDFSKVCYFVVLLCTVHFTIILMYLFVHKKSAAFLSRAVLLNAGDAVTVISDVTVNVTESPDIRNHELQICLETALGESPAPIS